MSGWSCCRTRSAGSTCRNTISTAPFPRFPTHLGGRPGHTSLRNVGGWALEEGLTIRQLYERFAGARGQRTLKGSPIEIADDRATWFLNFGGAGLLGPRGVSPAARARSR